MRDLRLKAERLKIMKYQRLSGPSSEGPSGPTLVMEGGRAHPSKHLQPKEYHHGLLNNGQGPFPSQAFAAVRDIGSLVVSKAGAVAKEPVHRGMGVLVVSAGRIHTICDGS